MPFIERAHAAEAVQTETTTAADQGLLASFGIQKNQIIAQGINFAIVVAVLWFLILKPLTKKMTERQNMIDESIENSKKIQEALHRSEADYQQTIEATKIEANKILEKTATEATQLKNTMKEEAQREVEALIIKAKQNIKAQKDEMIAELREETADLVVLALEKVLVEKIGSKKDHVLIEDVLNRLK